jgi:hypothetical protein
MNYYKARERKDGRWDYTCMNDGMIWPVGYCAKYVDPMDYNFPGCEVFQTEHHLEKARVVKDKHHEDGHATADEACACYGKYLLDNKLRLGLKYGDMQRKCEVCGEWTELNACVDNQYMTLCEKHNNREEVEKLFRGVGERWES